MKVLVTGAGGMLATDLVRQPGAEFAGLAEEQLDILGEPGVHAALAVHRPDWLVNCAAYTNVDGCEGDDGAYRVNAVGPGVLARACREAGVRLLQLSTDYVFGGAAQGPYREEDAPNPLNAYGQGKLDGERNALKEFPDGVTVVRSAWLYGAHGRCFPATILRAARDGRDLRVVNDQTGSPTYTVDLASALVALLALGPPAGILHVTNSGSGTWYDVAVETLRLAGVTLEVTPISTREWPTPAHRPACSVLDCSKAYALGLPQLRSWRAALADFVSAASAQQG